MRPHPLKRPVSTADVAAALAVVPKQEWLGEIRIDLHESALFKADLRSARLREAQLGGCRFDEVHMEDAFLEGQTGGEPSAGADFNGCTLVGLTWKGPTLGANLRDCLMEGLVRPASGCEYALDNI